MCRICVKGGKENSLSCYGIFFPSQNPAILGSVLKGCLFKFLQFTVLVVKNGKGFAAYSCFWLKTAEFLVSR